MKTDSIERLSRGDRVCLKVDFEDLRGKQSNLFCPSLQKYSNRYRVCVGARSAMCIGLCPPVFGALRRFLFLRGEIVPPQVFGLVVASKCIVQISAEYQQGG